MAKRVKHRLWLEKQPVFFIRQVFGIISELHVAEPPDKFVDGIANIESDFMDWRGIWEEHAGLIFDEIHKTQIKETSEYSRTKNLVAVGLIGVSFLDGPAPIMDAIAVIGWELLLGD